MTILIGFVLDIIIGDPKSWPHPIKMIGWIISRGETIGRRVFPSGQRGEILAGGFLSIIVISLSFGLSLGILTISYGINFFVGIAVEAIMCFFILSTKSLVVESMLVYKEIEGGNLNGAREKLARIVGRDTDDLCFQAIERAAVETVAENTADGTVAPIVFMAIGGAPLGFAYKAANTLDSMIGYKNDRYINFGRVAAKIDDVLNFVPSRLSAVLMVFAALLNGYDHKNGIKIFKRDRFNHPSPNSAQTEAVCAGALNIQLAGDSYYFGKLYRKKTIGDDNRDISREDIRKANRMLITTAILVLLLAVPLRVATGLLMGIIIW